MHAEIRRAPRTGDIISEQLSTMDAQLSAVEQLSEHMRREFGQTKLVRTATESSYISRTVAKAGRSRWDLKVKLVQIKLS